MHVAVIRKFGRQSKGKGACQHLTGIKENTGHIITLICLSVVASRKKRPICSEAVELAVLLLNAILCVTLLPAPFLYYIRHSQNICLIQFITLAISFDLVNTSEHCRENWSEWVGE
jgi:hypothetical protein